MTTRKHNPPHPHPRMRHRAAGFTLLEALVAGTILAIVGVAIASAASHALRASGRSEDYQRAAELLDRTMTRIDMIGPARLYSEGPRAGSFREPYTDYRWEADIEPLSTNYLYEVTVRVTWPAPGGVRSAELVTRLNDAPQSRDASLQWGNL